MNFLTLALLRLFPSPEGVRDLIEDERERIKLYQDGVLMPNPEYEFEVWEILKKKALVVMIDLEPRDNDMEPFDISVWTRFKNDGTDSIKIKGEPMEKEDFEFHCKPLKKEFAIELGYTDSQNEKHLILITNAEPKPKKD